MPKSRRLRRKSTRRMRGGDLTVESTGQPTATNVQDNTTETVPQIESIVSPQSSLGQRAKQTAANAFAAIKNLFGVGTQQTGGKSRKHRKSRKNRSRTRKNRKH